MSEEQDCTWLICKSKQQVAPLTSVLRSKFRRLNFKPQRNGQANMIQVTGPEKHINHLKMMINSVSSAR